MAKRAREPRFHEMVQRHGASLNSKTSTVMEWLDNPLHYPPDSSWPYCRAMWQVAARPFTIGAPAELPACGTQAQFDQYFHVAFKHAAENGRVDVLQFFLDDLDIDLHAWCDDLFATLPRTAAVNNEWDVVKYFQEKWDYDPTSIRQEFVNRQAGELTSMMQYYCCALPYKELWPIVLTPISMDAVPTFLEYSMDL